MDKFVLKWPNESDRDTNNNKKCARNDHQSSTKTSMSSPSSKQTAALKTVKKWEMELGLSLDFEVCKIDSNQVVQIWCTTCRQYAWDRTSSTTIAAIEFDGGVIIGADSRTTSGAYIANRVTDKLTKVTDYIYCCRSGSAADTQAVADLVNYYLNFYKMELGEEPLVKTAASVFRNVCYNNRDSLSAGILVAGWDKRLGGQVYTIPLGGMWTRMPVAIGGSGSGYLYGYVDANYKQGMSKDECLKFIANAISLAINRDGSSGGVIRLACITKDGTERFLLTGDQIPKFFEDA